MNTKKYMISNKWIFGPWQDIIFVLLPPFLVVALVFLFPFDLRNHAIVSPWTWLILVVGIDVAHVYSTLYRTYFDRLTRNAHRTILYATPLLVFIAGALVYSAGPGIFWRIAAYLAVFHFIRQQYGFARIYSRNENHGKASRLIDVVTIYLLTFYPIAHWHLTGPHSFNWFVDGDFFYFHSPLTLLILQVLYWSAIVVFVIKELYWSFLNEEFNAAKWLLFAGTGLSWYIGIITFDGDLVFTLLNVVSHGIPYMALIWFTGNKKNRLPVTTEKQLRKGFAWQDIFRPRNIAVFILILLAFAFAEEALWDRLVWRDHPEFFGFMAINIPDSLSIDRIIVPLLSVPQFTHYVIDGFIWKIRNDKYDWSGKTLAG